MVSRFKSGLMVAGLGVWLAAAACEGLVTPTPAPADAEPTATADSQAETDKVAPTATSDRMIVKEVGKKAPASTIFAGDPYVLDGARSLDDGVVQTATWKQLSGPYAFISDSGSVAPSIVPSTAGTYEFELTITDNSSLSSFQTVVFEAVAPPTGGRANVGPIRWMAPEALAFGGPLTIQFVVSDSTADLVDVAVEFSVDGGTTWKRATGGRRVVPVTVFERVSGPSGDGSAESTGALTVPEIDDEVLVSRTVVPDAGALERQGIASFATPTPESELRASGDPASGMASGRRIHHFVWDAPADLGSQATEVLVRGWDPVKKEPIRGHGKVNQYDPLMLDLSSSCKLHPDLWLLDAAVTTARNQALDECAAGILNELQAEGSLTAAQGKEIIDGLAAYSDEVRSTLVVPHLLEQSGTAKALDDMMAQNMQFLALQNAVQMESRKFQTLSNIMKVKHDVAMKSIQNMRA